MGEILGEAYGLPSTPEVDLTEGLKIPFPEIFGVRVSKDFVSP